MTVVQAAGRRIALRMRARSHVVPAMTTSAALVLGSTGILLAGGLIMILSASWVAAYERYGSSFLFFSKQSMWAAAGSFAMLIASRVDYRKLRLVGYGLLAISFVGLLVVLHPAIGTTVGGSTRWIALGPMRLQPSELAKLALVLVGADLCARKTPKRLRTWQDVFMPYGLIAGIVGGLVMLQPDLGTTIILAGITFATLYLAGTRGRVLTGLGVSCLAGVGVLSLTADYRLARLKSFIDPFADPLFTGYQAVQAQIALGSGGLAGVGLGASRQKWTYVPNAHTDFIFAIIGEEVGLIGTFAVLTVFGLLCYAGIRTARRAPDAFGRILAGGITAWIIGQAIINMGAVTGLMPITGVPLPLVSFGGSSLVFTLAALGILVNIARQEKWPARASAEPAPKRAHAVDRATKRAPAREPIRGRGQRRR